MKFSKIRKNYPKSYKLFADYLFNFIKNNSFTFILKEDEVKYLNYDTNNEEIIEFELYLGIVLRFFYENSINIHATNKKMIDVGFQLLEGKILSEEKKSRKLTNQGE